MRNFFFFFFIVFGYGQLVCAEHSLKPEQLVAANISEIAIRSLNLCKAGQYEKARNKCEELKSFDSKYYAQTNCMHLFAYCLVRAHQFQLAENAIASLEFMEDKSSMNLFLAKSQIENKEYDGAKASIGKALQTLPGTVSDQVYNDLVAGIAEAHIYLKDEKRAKSILDSKLKLSLNSFNQTNYIRDHTRFQLYRIAALYADMGAFDEAFKLFNHL